MRLEELKPIIDVDMEIILMGFRTTIHDLRLEGWKVNVIKREISHRLESDFEVAIWREQPIRIEMLGNFSVSDTSWESFGGRSSGRYQGYLNPEYRRNYPFPYRDSEMEGLVFPRTLMVNIKYMAEHINVTSYNHVVRKGEPISMGYVCQDYPSMPLKVMLVDPNPVENKPDEIIIAEPSILDMLTKIKEEQAPKARELLKKQRYERERNEGGEIPQMKVKAKILTFN